MKKKTLLVVFVLLLGLFLVACGGEDMADDSVSLEGTSWVLFAYRKSSPIPGTKITISFEDGQASGNASCNSYGGGYQVEGQQIGFDALFMTEMACMDPEGIMEQESTYLQMLADAKRFEIQEGRLILFMEGHETLTFEPAE
jgi:heat shock protein HslJ